MKTVRLIYFSVPLDVVDLQNKVMTVSLLLMTGIMKNGPVHWPIRKFLHHPVLIVQIPVLLKPPFLKNNLHYNILKCYRYRYSYYF